jgi:hypothetical protein
LGKPGQASTFRRDNRNREYLDFNIMFEQSNQNIRDVTLINVQILPFLSLEFPDMVHQKAWEFREAKSFIVISFRKPFKTSGQGPLIFSSNTPAIHSLHSPNEGNKPALQIHTRRKPSAAESYQNEIWILG